jgi:hypothetical protein
MKYSIVTVYDRVAEVYGTPYYAVSKGSAMRGFSDEVNRPDSNNSLYAHPDDFELMYLGQFDDQLGDFELQSKPSILIKGSEVSVKTEQKAN